MELSWKRLEDLEATREQKKHDLRNGVIVSIEGLDDFEAVLEAAGSRVVVVLLYSKVVLAHACRMSA